MMTEFIVGQRWISDAETDLGLGIVTAVEHRRVTLEFPACSESRAYASAQAPLTRVKFFPGDDIQTHAGDTLYIDYIDEQDGLVTYHGKNESGTVVQINESELSDATQLNKPRDRLLTGQVDNQQWYPLRYQTLLKRFELAQVEVRGLLGPRVSLIPHQLYIAHQVASRNAPRVLLADEVGLGKTIEAGLIIHHQLVSDRARRVLIIVPEALLYQWMIEMLRRFNLRMSLFDRERYESIPDMDYNPFIDEPLLLCSLEFVTHNDKISQQLVEAEWDIMVVDEAHHLVWAHEQVSPEYQCIETLATNIPGVLLLTATPEQLGEESHFARLRLLDPHRYHDLDRFLAEVTQFRGIAEVVGVLIDGSKPDVTIREQLLSLFDIHPEYKTLAENYLAQPDNERLRQQLIQIIADQHGTGRVLFRNTRSVIKGFPQRDVHTYPLPYPDAYKLLIHTYIETSEDAVKPELLLTPELIYQNIYTDDNRHWAHVDSRIDWLADFLSQHRRDKILIICAHVTTVIDLASCLHERFGKHAAVFHENMSILQRDRAAAYFADMEEGSQILICSEIGSEGRNFQFAHHLVLFDLPFNPDLLEQRIGRLDRIGQTETIHIHVPCFEHSPQAIMLSFYNEGLNAFKLTCPIGQAVLQKNYAELLSYLILPEFDAFAMEQFIYMVKADADALREDMHQGRDRLLELNPFQQREAQQLSETIQSWDHSNELLKYLQGIFDMYGIDFEDCTYHTYTINPTDHMLIHHFPELPGDGATLTFSRDHALAHENIRFMTWEHPMVEKVMDLLLSHEHGNTALSIVQHPLLKKGHILLECIFVVECSAASKLQIHRYLPPAVIRIVMNNQQQDVSAQFDFDSLQGTTLNLHKQIIMQLIATHQAGLQNMFSQGESLAQLQSDHYTSTQLANMQTQLESEIQRLCALQQHNPNIRDDEINALRNLKDTLTTTICRAYLKLDATRIIIGA